MALVDDPDDAAFIAAAIAVNADAIWTHDKHLLCQERIRTMTNIDVLRLL